MSDGARRSKSGTDPEIRQFRAEDEGKRVVAPDGSVLGEIARVRGEDVFVTPRSDLLRGCGSWLCGTWETVETFPLDPRTVSAIREDRIVLEDTTSRPVSGPIIESR